jgi:hypothetical protein
VREILLGCEARQTADASMPTAHSDLATVTRSAAVITPLEGDGCGRIGVESDGRTLRSLCLERSQVITSEHNQVGELALSRRNRGSSPLGSANNINKLDEFRCGRAAA